jgi:hypothetical protein
VGGLQSPPEGKNQREDKQKHIKQIYIVSVYNITIKQDIPKWHHTMTTYQHKLSTSTHLELALVTNRCKEALCSTGDILLAVAAHF